MQETSAVSWGRYVQSYRSLEPASQNAHGKLPSVTAVSFPGVTSLAYDFSGDALSCTELCHHLTSSLAALDVELGIWVEARGRASAKGEPPSALAGSGLIEQAR